MHREIVHCHPSQLKMLTGKDYESYGFDREYFHVLLDHMGLDGEIYNFDDFEAAHFETLSTFLQCQQKVEKWSSITVENKALKKVAQSAANLTLALEELHSETLAGLRLHGEIKSDEKGFFQLGGHKLADLLGHREIEPFIGLVQILYDLRKNIERAKIKKKRDLSLPKLPDDKANFKEFMRSHSIKKDAFVSSERTEAERYREHVQNHALPVNFALVEFLGAFEEMWHQFSPLRFTEGKHEPDAKQHISRAVDAAEHCLRKFNADYPRSIVENKLRSIREQRYNNRS